MLVPVPASRPPSAKDRQAGQVPTHGTTEGPQMLDLFRDIVPVPMELPGAPYFDGDKAELRPWFYQEN